MLLLLIVLLMQYFLQGSASIEDTLPVDSAVPIKSAAPPMQDVDVPSELSEKPQRPSIFTMVADQVRALHRAIMQSIIRIGRAIMRCFRFSRREPEHPTVAMRPLSEREELAPVQLMAKGIDITLKRQVKGTEDLSNTVHSLLHGSSVMNPRELIVCEHVKDGYCRLKRRVFIEIDVPKGRIDLSAQAATTAIRLLYQIVLQTALIPGTQGAVERFVFDEYPFIRCTGQCAAFEQQYAEIMHSTVGLLWEAVESIGLVDHSAAGEGKGESFEAFMKDLARKRQILLANRMDEYRVVPLPVNA